MLAIAVEPSAGAVVWATAAAGLVATVLAGALWVTAAEPRPPGWGADPWLRPAVGFAVVTALFSVAAATTALPRRDLLVPALLVAAAESALFGALLEKVAFAVASPILGCAAWLVFASEALTGNPQWFTVPSGVTLLLIVGLVRQDRRRRDRAVHTHTLAALDDVGMAFVVGAALVQTVVDSIGYGLLAAAFGGALGLWGASTRVRRRVAGGAATVTLAILLLIGVPMADIVRDAEMSTSQPMLWVLLSAGGIVAILAASVLEHGRSRMRQALGRVGDITRDWE